jgi:hypothetical protein
VGTIIDMPKKTTKEKAEKPKKAVKVKDAIEPAVTVEAPAPAVSEPKKRTKKAAAKPVGAKKPVAKKASAKKTVKRPTNEDIALRAYFIAERRHQMGWPGDSTGDWVEAERQLLAEAGLSK